MNLTDYFNAQYNAEEVTREVELGPARRRASRDHIIEQVAVTLLLGVMLAVYFFH